MPQKVIPQKLIEGNERLLAMPDRVSGTFSGQTVTITGGTGFMGKVFVEKLLRKCPDVKEIILFVRPKKGVRPSERITQIFDGPLFEKLIALRGGVQKIVEKVRVVAGDVGEPDLGISEKDRRYMEEHTDIFVHGAASVRFDEPLKKVINLHVRGTKMVLDLAKACKNLKLFVHVSTAYCHLQSEVIEERPYDPPADPHNVIAAADIFDEATLETMKSTFLGSAPNSYTYTKSLSEALAVEAHQAGLPVIIVRPSIVVGIMYEPVPGWMDNINGPAGLLIGAGKGVLRSMYCKEGGYADYIPVDIAINAMMLAMWYCLHVPEQDEFVFNLTSSEDYIHTWRDLVETSKKVSKEIPLNGAAWYPSGDIHNSKAVHMINVVLFHYLPALLVDTILFILYHTGLSPHKPVLLRVQKRITKGMAILDYFISNQWTWKSDRMRGVRDLRNEREQLEFPVDHTRNIDVYQFYVDSALCTRRYLLKQPDDTLPAAKRHNLMLWWLDLAVRVLFWMWVASKVYSWIF